MTNNIKTLVVCKGSLAQLVVLGQPDFKTIEDLTAS